jgi:ADP-heptose:LPS heptosyltransferase
VLNVLVIRLDSAGDVLLAGPAVRAVAAGADRVTLLAGPRGRAAAELLPGVDEILSWHCPWIDPEPGPVTREGILTAADTIAGRGFDRAVIFGSFHQDPLPTALLLRLAGVPHISAESENYPGSLLNVRHRLPGGDLHAGQPSASQPGTGGPHEVERMLSVAEAAGFPPPDDARLRLRGPLPDVAGLLGEIEGPRYVVVHPGASVPARAPAPRRCAEYVAALAAEGWAVAVTGAPEEEALTARVAAEGAAEGARRATGPGPVLDLGGRTSLAELAAVLAGASAVVAPNTGPAHLAAAAGTPVVSLFAPTVPPERWRPWRVPHVVLGDPGAPCAGTRARNCPVPGHPCLDGITPDQVTGAVTSLTGQPSASRHSNGQCRATVHGTAEAVV